MVKIKFVIPGNRSNKLTLSVEEFKHFYMKSDYKQVIPPEWGQMSKVFMALGDGHRQRIMLLFEPKERLNVSRIAAVSTLTRPTVSHHLKILREAGVLNSEKIGKEVWFWVNKDFLKDTFTNVLDYVREYV